VAQAQVDLLVGGPGEGELAAAESQVRQAAIVLDQAELALDKASLVTPISGVVAAVNVVPREAPPVGRPAVSIIDASGFRVTVPVDELDVGRLDEGQPVEVTLDALPGERIEGEVRRIGPAAGLDTGVVSYDAVIDLVSTDAGVRVDMTANVTIQVEQLLDVLTVPIWVVRVDRLTNQTYVDRRVGDRVERVDVDLGVRNEGVVEVRGGLAEGDVVVRLPDSGVLPFELGQ
jgi:HlyD family secretion protein